MCTVSVIITAYNHRDYILDSIKSVFEQAYKDYEIIVVNDGSPDDTADVLKPLVEAGKIRYIEQKNAGQASARNLGIKEARGAFIAFLDDDDIWPSNKLQWQVDYLLQHADVAGVSGGFSYEWDVDKDKVALPLNDEKDLDITEILKGNPICSPGQVLIRTSALLEVGCLDVSIWGADDWDLWIRLIKKNKMVTFNRLSLFYRIHSSNASRNKIKMLDNCIKAINKNIGSRKKEKDIITGYSEMIFESYIISIIRYAKGEFLKGNVYGFMKIIFDMMRCLFKLKVDNKLYVWIAKEILPVRLMSKY